MSSKSENLKPDAISHSWEQLKIGKFAKTVAGGTPSTTNPSYWNGDIRWMNSGELNHKMVYEIENRITELGLRNSSTSLLPLDCVLIGLAGQGKTRGTVAINKVQLCTNQSIAAILPNDKTLPLYLYYNLDSRYEELRRLSTGDGGRGGLNLSIINGIKIPIPPKEEQKAIANCLSTWDDAIEKQTKLIAAKEQRKKALMQQLLSGKKRLPGFTETWKTFLIEDISKIGRGRVISKEYLNENQGIYPVYSSQTVNDGVFGRIKTYDYDGEYITWTTDGVNAGTVTYREGKFNCTNVCGTIKLKDSSINPRFLAYKLNTIAFRYVSRTLANPKLMNNVMASITIDLPYLDEQNKIADILQSAELEIRKNIIKLNLLKFQKKGLMQKLLTGQVRINQ